MTTLIQGQRAGEHLISTMGAISSELVLLGAGPALPAGQVLALDEAAGVYVPYDNASATAGKADAVLYAPVSARAEPVRGVITARLAEVHGGLLTGLDAAARVDLAAKFIVIR